MRICLRAWFPAAFRLCIVACNRQSGKVLEETMANPPNRHEQIRLVHAHFICQVVETCQNPERKRDFETLLYTAAENGWADLVGAVRRIAAGERDPDRLCRGMDAQGESLVLDILRELGRLETH